MLNTPILFLVFNRPNQTQQVFERIREAKPKFLYVAADGPRKGIEGEEAHCALAREIAIGVDWDCKVRTLFRDYNLGCGRAVSEAINWFFETVEEGIILEDDCLVDLSFFNFASSLLEKYRNEVSVMHISANGLINPKHNLYNIFFKTSSYSFVQYPLIWGWATWKRAWNTYDFNMNSWEETGEELLQSRFRNRKSINYWRSIFESVTRKEIDTWDYQWVYACLKENGLSIIPQSNLVNNIGFGADATHLVNSHDKRANMQVKPINSKLSCPNNIELNRTQNYRLEEEVFGLTRNKTLYKRLFEKVKRKINKQ